MPLGERFADVFGNHEPWRRDTRHTLDRVFDRLRLLGVTEGEAVALLRDVVGAISEEYGE